MTPEPSLNDPNDFSLASVTAPDEAISPRKFSSLFDEKIVNGKR